jgi:hypothetical protein
LGMPANLISMHFPKAAGSSLVLAYESALGADRVLRDYGNDPLDPCGLINLHPARYSATKPTSLGPYKAVHGHFHIGRYDRIRDAVRVVSLREPVDNLLSIYYYWDYVGRQQGHVEGRHCLYRYFCRSDIGLLEFATMPSLQNLMSRTYFRDVDMACFDAIGDYSDLAGYLQRVTSLTGIDSAALPKANVTPQSDERRAAAEDPRTLARLRDLLAEDLRFYERYCNR